MLPQCLETSVRSSALKLDSTVLLDGKAEQHLTVPHMHSADLRMIVGGCKKMSKAEVAGGYRIEAQAVHCVSS